MGGLGFTQRQQYECLPRGSTYTVTTIMELGPQNRYRDGLLKPNSIMAICIYIYNYIYMDPLGFMSIKAQGPAIAPLSIAWMWEFPDYRAPEIEL